MIASRSDSTLRGYFPLETDVLVEELAARGTVVDGVIVCPSYVEPVASRSTRCIGPAQPRA